MSENSNEQGTGEQGNETPEKVSSRKLYPTLEEAKAEGSQGQGRAAHQGSGLHPPRP